MIYICRHCGRPAIVIPGNYHTGTPVHLHKAGDHAGYGRRDDGTYVEPFTRCNPADPDSPTCEAVEAEIATDGNCRLSWVDNVPTSMTPTPSARCPFEYFHIYDERFDDALVIGAEPIPPDYPVQPVPCPWCDAKPYARHARTCPV